MAATVAVTDMPAVTTALVMFPVMARPFVMEVMNLAWTPARFVMVIFHHSRTAVVMTMMMTVPGQHMADDHTRDGAGDEHAHAVIMCLCLRDDRDCRQRGDNNQKLVHTLLPSNSQWMNESLPPPDRSMGNHL